MTGERERERVKDCRGTLFFFFFLGKFAEALLHRTVWWLYFSVRSFVSSVFRCPVVFSSARASSVKSIGRLFD